MNGVLTCQLVVSCVDTGTDFIPYLTSIFVSIFVLIDNQLAVNDLMWFFRFVIIIKSRLSLRQAGNPRSHMLRIRSKCVKNIICTNSPKIRQCRKMTNYFSKRSLWD